jgi:hypothetical protein
MSIGILEAVRDELIACEAVGSGRVFCESWLAKDASYIRVLKFHNKDPRLRTHNQNRTVAARAIADMKTFGHLS